MIFSFHGNLYQVLLSVLGNLGKMFFDLQGQGGGRGVGDQKDGVNKTEFKHY